MWYLFFLLLQIKSIHGLSIFPPSGINPLSSLLGRESDAQIMGNKGNEWIQSPSPAGGFQWNQYYSFTDSILPTDLAEPRFQIFYPLIGEYIIPDTLTYVTWNTILPTLPAIAVANPTDIRIELYQYNAAGQDADIVQVIAHSIPNQGVFLWVARVPRAWSNDAWFFLRLISVQDTHVYSDSEGFRILNPYAFYP